MTICLFSRLKVETWQLGWNGGFILHFADSKKNKFLIYEMQVLWQS